MCQRSPGTSPDNLIYPVFTGRVRPGQAEQVRRENSLSVWPHDGNIVSRVAVLATGQFPEALQFRELCREVLGFEVNVIPGDHEQHLGLQINKFDSIPLDAMGAGVAGVLNLIVSLCGSQGKLFLIEEPENDLHPHALKALLDAVLAASDKNQFIISTHSNIVLTRLGALPDSVVLHTATDDTLPPRTSFEVIETTERRIEALQELGYELADMHLGGGWIIFEESSAETLIRQYLIPWFAPGLRTIRTVAATGTSRVGPLFIDFKDMLLFAHLEPLYKYRAWVIVDGDESGLEVVKELRKTFREWPSDRFSSWSVDYFEEFYPNRFRARIDETFAIEDRRKRKAAKWELLKELLEWMAGNEEEAKEAFAQSAAEVIGYLQKVELEISAHEFTIDQSE
ncbi:hypothetical protein GCM10009760_53640 [Kitasatospora kazusensis]|uniref:ATPase AAA-type core domain-containing protein n=2 Tax=Kitasatospora kazusensis TaxID=407974 RepID=A0ABN3A6K5_9ACTN